MNNPKYKVVYCTPAIYSAGGVERIVSVKASYFADVLGYDVTVILTEGKGRESFFPLSDKVKVVNYELGFEELWNSSFFRKILLYLRKQRKFKKLLTADLMHIRPDFTISTFRREINFITQIRDGSRKIGELHLNRENYRNFEANETNFLKEIFAKFWTRSLVGQLKKLDQLVVLTEESRSSWSELSNVVVIPDPQPFHVDSDSKCREKRVISIGRYAYQKGYDMLLKAWSEVEKACPDWQLAIYGMGDRSPYRKQMEELGIDANRCFLNGPVDDVTKVYLTSSLFVLSSRFEGFGLVIVEAMSCGVPVIAFDCKNGPRSIISDGEDGILVPPADIKALVSKMIEVIQDSDRRRTLSENGLKKCPQFAVEKIGKQWEMLFDKLMHEK